MLNRQTGGSPGPVRNALVTFGIALALFGPGLGLHEAIHLAVLHGLGGDGSLIVRPWRFALIDLALPSLHAQPIPPLDRGRQLAVNFFGPAIGAAAFALVLIAVRDRRLRLAVVANVAVLAFYSVIEAADVIGDSALNADVAALGTPEFNYGVPLGIYLTAAFLAALDPAVSAGLRAAGSEVAPPRRARSSSRSRRQAGCRR